MGNLDAIRALDAARGGEGMQPESGTALEWNAVIGADGTEGERARERARAKYHASPRADADAQAAHDELMQMCAEVDMLDLARRDTGEMGRRSGGYVAFRDCPLCGHRDCFRVYPATNTCACFSGSNDATKPGRQAAGGTVIDYLTQRHHGDVTAAVAELRDMTGHPYESKRDGRKADKGNENADKGAGGYRLPRWEHVRASDPPRRNPVLIPGILRRGHVAVLVAKGKAGKSCGSMELAIATATGGEWFGRRVENGGGVLFIDPEIHSPSAHVRFHKLCDAMGADPATVDARVLKWPLRGTVATIVDICKDIEHGIETGDLADLALVVIDSASMFIENDENSSVEVRKFAAQIMKIAAITGASVLAVAHTGKAKDGDRDAADRARGSSVWLDFPDALITLSETYPPSGEPSDYLGEGRFGCVMEAGGLREFGRFEPYRCIFDYPAHVPDTGGLTDGWKADSNARKGGKATAEGNRAKSADRAHKCESALLAEFVARGTAEGIPAKEAAELVSAAMGETVKTQTLKAYIEASDTLTAEQVSPQRWQVAPRRKPPEQPPRLDL